MSVQKPVILDPLSGVQSGRPGAISFVLGLPDPATFPVDALQEATRTVLQTNAEVALQYAPEQGFGHLIDCLVQKWRRDEQMSITREKVTIAFGSTDAVNMLSQLLARAGDVIIVEAPSYRDTLHLFRDQGLRLVQVPVDDQGLQPVILRRTLLELRRDGVKPRFVYTIPTFQNPSGVTLSLSRRKEVIELAKEFDFLIMSDDVYRDLYYEEGVPPALGALDPQGDRVITIGSFSKLLAAGLRLGWVIASPEIATILSDSGARNMGGGANPLISHIVANFCKAGHLEGHIQALRELYKGRRDVMLDALEVSMPDVVSWNKPDGGYFVWLKLPSTLSAAEVVRVADEDGVTCLAGTAFYAGDGGDDHIRLAFSYVPTDEIEEGIALLARVIGKLASL